MKEILLPVHDDPQSPLTLLRTEFIKLRRLILAKERLVVIVMVEVVVMLDGIKLKLYECVPYLLLFQKEVFHEGPCHAPFRAPALVHIEPKNIIHLFCYRTNHCKQ